MPRYEAALTVEFDAYLAAAVRCDVPEKVAIVPISIFADVAMGRASLKQAEVKFRLFYHLLSQQIPYGVGRYACSRLIALCRARARQLVN